MVDTSIVRWVYQWSLGHEGKSSPYFLWLHWLTSPYIIVKTISVNDLRIVKKSELGMNIDMPADFGVFFSAQLYEKTCSKIAQSKPVPAVPTAERWGLELSSLVPQQGVLGDLLASAFQDGEMGWSTGTPAGPKKKAWYLVDATLLCNIYVIIKIIIIIIMIRILNNTKYTFIYTYTIIYLQMPHYAPHCTQYFTPPKLEVAFR